MGANPRPSWQSWRHFCARGCLSSEAGRSELRGDAALIKLESSSSVERFDNRRMARLSGAFNGDGDSMHAGQRTRRRRRRGQVELLSV